jgi:hypothetical protein
MLMGTLSVGICRVTYKSAAGVFSDVLAGRISMLFDYTIASRSLARDCAQIIVDSGGGSRQFSRGVRRLRRA